MKVDLSAPLDLSRPVAVLSGGYGSMPEIVSPARIICTDAQGATGLYGALSLTPIVVLVKFVPDCDDETACTFPLDGGRSDGWYVLRNVVEERAG